MRRYKDDSTKSKERMDVYSLRKKRNPICVGGQTASRQMPSKKGGQATFVDGESEDVG